MAIKNCVVLLLSISGLVYAGEIFKDPKGTFTCEMPDNFQKAPVEKCATDYICTYYIPAKPAEIPITIAIQKLGKTIGWKHLRKDDLAAIKKENHADKITMLQIPWGEYKLDAVCMYLKSSDGDITSTSMEIPIREEAVKVIILGPAKSFQQQLQYLKELIPTIEGKTNWKTESENLDYKKITGKIMESTKSIFVLIPVLGIALLWYLSRKTSKAVVLIIPAVLLAIGIFMPSSLKKDLQLISGNLILLGIAGILLGVINLFAKKTPKNTTQTPPPIPSKY